MTYTGVTSVNESPFWDTIQDTPFGMKAYQHYISGIKEHQDAMCEIQQEIEVLLAELNYQETLKDDVEEYEEMIQLLIWIGECPDYAEECPYKANGTSPNVALCNALDADITATVPGAQECKTALEAILGSCP
jgi:hypothetical protein